VNQCIIYYFINLYYKSLAWVVCIFVNSRVWFAIDFVIYLYICILYAIIQLMIYVYIYSFYLNYKRNIRIVECRILL